MSTTDDTVKQSEGPDDASPVFKFKKKGNKGKRNIRKRERADSGDEKREAFAKPAVVRPAKQKKTGVLSATSGAGKTKLEQFKIESTKTTENTVNDSATRAIELSSGEALSAQARYERSQKLQEDADENLKTYRGAGGYKQYTKVTAPNESLVKGPMRAPTNVRAISRFDYQPDICKDYKETGFCGYGDSCKFLHDRGDYKSGWQLEKDWEAQQARGGAAGSSSSDDSSDNSSADSDGVPFVCLICRGPYKNPVVTRCNHYFCEECALKHFSKDKNCAVCGVPTQGNFNRATKVYAKLDTLKARHAARMRKLQEEDDGSDSE